MHRYSILAAGIFLLFASSSLGAQQRLDLERGDRVRVWVPSNGLTAQIATVDSVGEARITLLLPRLSYPLVVPMDSIARLDVPGGGRRSFSDGATIGGLVGLGAGLALIRIVRTPCLRDSGCEVLPIGTVPVSVLVGALFGGFLATDPWTRIWPRP